jgi:hypothetical protein
MDDRGVLCGCERCPVRLADRGGLVDGAWSLVLSAIWSAEYSVNRSVHHTCVYVETDVMGVVT